MARLSASGVLDQTFTLPNAPWQVAPGGVLHYLVGVQPNGQPIIVWYDNNRSYLTRLLASTGAVDNTFSIGSGIGGGPNVYYDARLQPNGQVILSGNFTTFDGQPVSNGVLRLLPNGQPDPSFTAAAPLNIVAIQPDGHLLGTPRQPVTDNFIAPVFRLRRLGPNGSLDPTFPTVEVPQSVYQFISVALQPQDGKILLSGWFNSVNGQFRGSLVRLNNTLLATRPALAAAPDLEAYPNPAQQHLTVRLPVAGVAATTEPVTLLDMQGRMVRRFAWPGQQAEATFSLRDVAPGVYLLQTSTRQGLARQRVVVTH